MSLTRDIHCYQIIWMRRDSNLAQNHLQLNEKKPLNPRFYGPSDMRKLFRYQQCLICLNIQHVDRGNSNG